MEEKTTWVYIVHYYWQNENGEIYDRIWTGKDFQRSKQFFKIRKDMLEYKVRNATIKVPQIAFQFRKGTKKNQTCKLF